MADYILLIASDAVSDVDLIRKSLSGEFRSIHASTDPNTSVEDFDRIAPDVLILAFGAISRSQQYYLGLFRHSTAIAAKSHRTILLCNKDDVREAYDLCRRDYFDDYVLYWPMAFDQPRLAMSIRLAQRALAAAADGRPDQSRLKEVARQVAEVQPLLDVALADGGEQLDAADQTLGKLASGLDDAVQEFSSGLTDRLLEMNAGTGMLQEVKRRLKALDEDHVKPHVQATRTAITPARERLSSAARSFRARMAAVRELVSEMASDKVSILIVEDEETQRQIFKHLLGGGRYAVSFAKSGEEAMRMASRTVPNLILMDVMLPDANGVELTRLLKRSSRLADVPVVIITGRSERQVVVQSLEAGAADFIVKPFTPRALQSKIEQYVNVRGSSQGSDKPTSSEQEKCPS